MIAPESVCHIQYRQVTHDESIALLFINLRSKNSSTREQSKQRVKSGCSHGKLTLWTRKAHRLSELKLDCVCGWILDAAKRLSPQQMISNRADKLNSMFIVVINNRTWRQAARGKFGRKKKRSFDGGGWALMDVFRSDGDDPRLAGYTN